MQERTHHGDLQGDGGYGDVHETVVGDRSPSEAVVDAIAAISDVQPADLDPLYTSIDPDALDALCESGGNDGVPSVSFDYHGFAVTVDGLDRVVVVEP